MQQIIVFTFWIIFSVLIQSVVLIDFPSRYVWTDLLFYLVVVLGLRFRLITSVILSALLGYIADTVSLIPYGASLISYILTLCFIRKVKENIYLENKLALFIWLIVFSVVKETVQFLFMQTIVSNFDLSAVLVGLSILRALWNALLGIFIVPFLDKLLFKDWTVVFRRKGLRG